MERRKTKPRSERVVRDEFTNVEMRFNQHPRKKTNMLVAGMFQMYKSGKSVAEVAAAYRRTRQCVWGMLSSRGYPLRTKESAGRYFTTCYGVKWFRTKDGYLRGTLDGARTTLHKVVWEKSRGPIPDGHVLHFLDGDKTRCAVSNLELVPKPEMAKKFKKKP